VISLVDRELIKLKMAQVFDRIKEYNKVQESQRLSVALMAADAYVSEGKVSIIIIIIIIAVLILYSLVVCRV
jgi:hypothetical protein